MTGHSSYSPKKKKAPEHHNQRMRTFKLPCKVIYMKGSTFLIRILGKCIYYCLLSFGSSVFHRLQVLLLSPAFQKILEHRSGTRKMDSLNIYGAADNPWRGVPRRWLRITSVVWAAKPSCSRDSKEPPPPPPITLLSQVTVLRGPGCGRAGGPTSERVPGTLKFHLRI